MALFTERNLFSMRKLFKAIACAALLASALAAQSPTNQKQAKEASTAASSSPQIDASVGPPKPTADLKAGTWKYKGKISAGGQEIPIDLTTEIKEEGGAWTAVDTMKGPMGEGVDTASLQKGTLLVRKRNIKQGPASIDLNYSDNKATGTMNVDGQDRPVAADLGGPIFAETGSAQLIACLPLADGYTATFRNFDLRKQKEKLMQLKVVGSESVTVAAGTFNAFKIEITSADAVNDSETLWIAKDSRKAVKIAAVLGSMGGATLTVELLP